METTMYDMSEAPQYIKWERPSRKTVYYVPLIAKMENDNNEQAYTAMYARRYVRNGVTRYQMNEYLFRVEGCTMSQTMQRFGERLQDLQEAGVVQGRIFCADEVQYSHRTLIQEALYRKTQKNTNL